MRPTLLIVIVAIFAALLTVVVSALSRHKKASAGDIQLIGERGQVDTKLDPEGTVIIGGELWRAKSNDGAEIAARARVRVIGFEDHLAVVEPGD
jgi:membrane protein implicated in regulation of membrane protease activity